MLLRGRDVPCIPHESRQGRRPSMSVGSSNVASSQDEESKGTDICRCAGSNPMDSTDEPLEMEIHILPADIEDTTQQPLSMHNVHRGTDLSSQDTMADIFYDFDPKNEATHVTTYTRGGRSIFVVGDDTDLVKVCAKGRVKLPLHGRAAWLQSTCMVRLGTCCVGVETRPLEVWDCPRTV